MSADTTIGPGSGEPDQGKGLLADLQRYIVSLFGNDFRPPRKDTYYNGLASCVRERLIVRWLAAQHPGCPRILVRPDTVPVVTWVTGPWLRTVVAV